MLILQICLIAPQEYNTLGSMMIYVVHLDDFFIWFLEENTEVLQFYTVENFMSGLVFLDGIKMTSLMGNGQPPKNLLI